MVRYELPCVLVILSSSKQYYFHCKTKTIESILSECCYGDIPYITLFYFGKGRMSIKHVVFNKVNRL